MELAKIQEGINALTTGGNTTASEMVEILKEETVVLKAISHLGSFNPFSYVMNEPMMAVLTKGGCSDATLKKVKGWRVETPKKEIGPFWALVERVRFYARSRCISGTSHMRAKELNEFLEVVRKAREEWDRGLESLVLKYDNLRDAFLETSKEAMNIFFEGDDFEFLRSEILKDVERSIPSKEDYIKRVKLIVDIAKPDGAFAFFDAEDARTINELSEEATKRQLLNITQDCCNNILRECGNLYNLIETSGGMPLTTKQIMQFDKAVKKGKGDNVLNNPVITEITGIMDTALSDIREDDYASASAECEDIFLTLLQFEHGIEGVDLLWSDCPIKKEVLAAML